MVTAESNLRKNTNHEIYFSNISTVGYSTYFFRLLTACNELLINQYVGISIIHVFFFFHSMA